MPKTVSIFAILVISRIPNRLQTPTECQSVHTRRFVAANYMAAMSAYDLSFDCTHKAICCSNVLQQFVASCVPAFILQIVSCRSASDSFTVLRKRKFTGRFTRSQVTHSQHPTQDERLGRRQESCQSKHSDACYET